MANAEAQQRRWMCWMYDRQQRRWGVDSGKIQRWFALLCVNVRVCSCKCGCDCSLSPLIWEWLVKALSLTQWDQPGWGEGIHYCSRPSETHTQTHTCTHYGTQTYRDPTAMSEHKRLWNFAYRNALKTDLKHSFHLFFMVARIDSYIFINHVCYLSATHLF